MPRKAVFSPAGLSLAVAVALLTACSGGGGEAGGGDRHAGNVACVGTGTRAAAVGYTATPAAAFGTRATGEDTLFARQWHLQNTGQVDGAVAGEDINVAGVWSSFDGSGVRIAVVDDGLEIAHPDLAANVVPGASYDYTTGGNDPTGGSHGTSVAGVAAAVGFNGLGVRGVAPAASLVGFNLLADSGSGNEADAMSRDASVAVSNNSWGPIDDTGLLLANSALWRAGVESGIVNGRNGLGTAYFWAAGNGGRTVDNSNYDGYANYNRVMAIAALDAAGRSASYSEPGANLLLAAPAGEFCDGSAAPATTVTVDRSGSLGANDGGSVGELQDPDYTQCFNGTSSAAPVVAGVAALVLQANPALSWRDLRAVLAHSARQNDPGDADWSSNGAGHWINHKYGFGAVDAQAAVNLAQTWTNFGEERTQTCGAPVDYALLDGSGTEASDPQYEGAVTSSIEVSQSSLSKVEFVDVVLTSDHSYSGDLEVVLTSPTGTRSVLAESHFCSGSGSCGPGFNNGWRFGSLRHMDETPNGTWTLSVRDGFSDDTGNFQSWQLVLRGH